MSVQSQAPPNHFSSNSFGTPVVDDNTNTTGGSTIPHPLQTAVFSRVPAHTSSPPEMKLFEDLRRQVEFYFSYYVHDKYLQQCAVAYGGMVPISILTGFPKVRELFAAAAIVPPNTTLSHKAEVQLLARALALEPSDFFRISHDGLWIFPTQNYSAWSPAPPPMPRRIVITPETSSIGTTESSSVTPRERTTVIVRDLPLQCDPKEVLDAFTTATMKPKSARPDVGNTWYVTFESESQAVEALEASQKRKISGYSIKARLKSERSVPTTATPTAISINLAVPDSQDANSQITSQITSEKHQYENQHSMMHHHHHYRHQQHYGISGMPMHHHYSYHMPVQQHGMLFTNPAMVPYGIAPVYPTGVNPHQSHYGNGLSMDHPQHLMPATMPTYPATVVDESSSNIQKASQGFGRPHNNNITQRQAKNEAGKGQLQQKDKNKQKRNNKAKKKGTGATNSSNPGSINTSGERRSEHQQTLVEEAQVQDEKRDTPSPTTNGTSTVGISEKFNSKADKNDKATIIGSNSNSGSNNNNSKPHPKKNKRQTNNKKDKKKQETVVANTSSKILSDEAFPSLPSQPANSFSTLPTRPANAYAQALLKPTIASPPTTATSSSPSSSAAESIGSAGNAIEAGMEKLCLETASFEKEGNTGVCW